MNTAQNGNFFGFTNNNNGINNQNMNFNQNFMNQNMMMGNPNMMMGNPNMMMGNQNMMMNNPNMMMNNPNMMMNNPNMMMGNPNMMMGNQNMMMNNPNMMMGNQNCLNNQNNNIGFNNMANMNGINMNNTNINTNTSNKTNENDKKDEFNIHDKEQILPRNKHIDSLVEANGDIVNIVFELSTGSKITIDGNINSTFKEIGKKFCQKINLDERYLDSRIRFICNSCLIPSDPNSSLEKLGLRNGSKVNVYDDDNVIGT